MIWVKGTIVSRESEKRLKAASLDKAKELAESLLPPIKMFTSDQLAEALDLEMQTLRKWRCARSGPSYVKIGRGVRYPRIAVLEWLVENTEIHGPDFIDNPFR